MRTTSDRIRHALSFEIIGLLLVTPLGAFVFHHPIGDIGVIAIVGATIATAWNYVFNLGFDHALLRLTGRLEKSLALRVGHAALFELGLTVLLLPFVMLYLGIGPLEALVMDIGFAVFYMVYAFVFNLAYDRIFPVPQAS
jgi:uncharacterized membrane protein